MQVTPSNPPTLLGLLWLSFRGVRGTFLGLAGLALAVAAWFIPPTEKVPLSWFVITLLLALAVVTTLLEAIRIARAHAVSPLPRVRLAFPFDATVQDSPVILMLDASPIFAFGLVVSVFIIEQDQYERFFAQGIVLNIQDDGLIQVKIDRSTPDSASTMDSLRKQSASVLPRLRVKPYVLDRSSTI